LRLIVFSESELLWLLAFHLLGFDSYCSFICPFIFFWEVVLFFASYLPNLWGSLPAFAFPSLANIYFLCISNDAFLI